MRNVPSGLTRVRGDSGVLELRETGLPATFRIDTEAEQSSKKQQIAPETLSDRLVNPNQAEIDQILRNHHPELAILASGFINVNPEVGGPTSGRTISERISGMQQVEFDRNATALICLDLLLKGSPEAWEKFKVRQTSDPITYESFSQLSTHIRNFVKSDSAADVLQSLVIISNAAKVGRESWDRMAGYLPNRDFPPNEVLLDKVWKTWPGGGVDHDTKLLALLRKFPEILPSFARQSEGDRAIILESLTLPGSAIGQFLRLEAPEGILTGFKEISHRAAALYKAHVILDLCAAKGGETQEGSLAMSENLAQRTLRVLDLVERHDARQAYGVYLQEQAQSRGVDLARPQGRAVTRLAVMMDIEAREQVGVIDRLFEAGSPNGYPTLPAAVSSRFCRALSATGLVGDPAVMDYYAPAVLINLLSKYGRTEDGIVRATIEGINALDKVHQEVIRDHADRPREPLQIVNVGDLGTRVVDEGTLSGVDISVQPKIVAGLTIYVAETHRRRTTETTTPFVPLTEPVSLPLRRTIDLPQHPAQSVLVTLLQNLDHEHASAAVAIANRGSLTILQTREMREEYRSAVQDLHHHLVMLMRFGPRTVDQPEGAEERNTAPPALSKLSRFVDYYIETTPKAKFEEEIARGVALTRTALKRLALLSISFPNPQAGGTVFPNLITPRDAEDLYILSQGSVTPRFVQQHGNAGGRVVLRRNEQGKLEGALFYVDPLHQLKDQFLLPEWLRHYGAACLVSALVTEGNQKQIRKELSASLSIRESGAEVGIQLEKDGGALVYPLSSRWIRQHGDLSEFRVTPDAARLEVNHLLDNLIQRARDAEHESSSMQMQLDALRASHRDGGALGHAISRLSKLVRLRESCMYHLDRASPAACATTLETVRDFYQEGDLPGMRTERAKVLSPGVQEFLRSYTAIHRQIQAELGAVKHLADSRKADPSMHFGALTIERHLSDPRHRLEALSDAILTKANNSYRPSDPRIWLYGGFTYSQSKAALDTALSRGGAAIRVHSAAGDLLGLSLTLSPFSAGQSNPRLASDYEYYGAPATVEFLGVQPTQSKIPVYDLLTQAAHIEYAGIAEVAAAKVLSRNRRGFVVHMGRGEWELYVGSQKIIKSDTPHTGQLIGEYQSEGRLVGLLTGISSRWKNELDQQRLGHRAVAEIAEDVGDFGLGALDHKEVVASLRGAIAYRVEEIRLLRELERREEILGRIKSIQSGARDDFQEVILDARRHFAMTLPVFWAETLERTHHWERWSNPAARGDLARELREISEQTLPLRGTVTRGLRIMSERITVLQEALRQSLSLKRPDQFQS